MQYTRQNQSKVTLPRRVEHLTEQVAKIRDSRLDMSQDRTAETFAMVISKVESLVLDLTLKIMFSTGQTRLNG